MTPNTSGGGEAARYMRTVMYEGPDQMDMDPDGEWCRWGDCERVLRERDEAVAVLQLIDAQTVCHEWSPETCRRMAAVLAACWARAACTCADPKPSGWPYVHRHECPRVAR